MSDKPIIDYTDEMDCLVAQGKGRNMLILTELEDPVRTLDGKVNRYRLEYRWLSKDCDTPTDEAWACCKGSECTYWNIGDEHDPGLQEAIDGKKTLFDVFQLF